MSSLNWQRGDLSGRSIHARLDGRDIVLEGGGIEVNGRGALLTTEECYLDAKRQVRNPGLSKSEFERALKEYLGVTAHPMAGSRYCRR